MRFIWTFNKYANTENRQHTNVEAARLNNCVLVSVQNLYHETQCETLKQRRTAHKLMQFHKMAYETNPPHCQSIQQAHYYTARQYLNIRLVLCKTKRLILFFSPSTVQLWNELSNKIFTHLLSTKIQYAIFLLT